MWYRGRVANPRPVATRPVASECVCDWLRDATGLDCDDRPWICIYQTNAECIPTAMRSSKRQHCQMSYGRIRCERYLLYILLKRCLHCIRHISEFCNLVTSSSRSLMGNMLATGLRGAGFAYGCIFLRDHRVK